MNWANAVLDGGSGDVELESAFASWPTRCSASPAMRLYVDAVAAIDRAGRAARRPLAQAHRDYAAAAALFNDDRFAAAAPGFASARGTILATARSRSRAALHQGAVAYVSGRARKPSHDSECHARRRRERKRYVYAARSRRPGSWACSRSRRGSFGEAQSRYEDTLDTFTRMGDVEQTGAAHSLLAALFDYLGDASSAWEHRVIAFESLAVSRSPKFKYQVLAAAVPRAQYAESPRQRCQCRMRPIAAAREWGVDAARCRRAGAACVIAGFARPPRATRPRTINDAQAAAQLGFRTPCAGRESKSPSSRPRVICSGRATRPPQPRRRRGPSKSSSSAAIGCASRSCSSRLAQANIAWGRTAEARAALDRGLARVQRRARGEHRRSGRFPRSMNRGNCSMPRSSCRSRKRITSAHLRWPKRPAPVGERNARNSAPPASPSVQAALGADEAILALNQFDDELAIWVITSQQHHGHDAVDVAPDVAAADRAAAARDLAGRDDDGGRARSVTTRSFGPVATQLRGRIAPDCCSRCDLPGRVVRCVL